MNKVSLTIPYQYDTVFSPFKAGEFDDALEFSEEQGFTGVELAIAYPVMVDTSTLNKKLAAHHLTVTTLSTGQIVGLEGLYLSSPDKDIRNRTIQIIKEHVELSEALGHPPVTLGLIRGKREKGDKYALMNHLKDSVMTCVEYAYKRGVTLQIEPICKAETCLINNTYEGLWFLKELGNPDNLGLLYDTFHSNIEDDGMPEAIEAAAGRITNIHLADSNRGLPGYGTIDFHAVYEAVANTGYQGAFALEALSVPSVDFVKKNCASSLFRIIKRNTKNKGFHIY
jgi:sugar phosphate isomerase/epimerase